MLNVISGLLGNGVAAGGGTSFESIATINGTGSSGSITFSSIPSTFKHLQVRCFMLSPTSDDAIYMRFNGDTGSNYAWHAVLGEGVTARAQGYATQPNMNIGGMWYGLKANVPSLAIVDILDYANTSKNKTMRSLAGEDNNATTYGSVGLMSGVWQSTSAINSLTIYLSGTANFSTTAQFALYGIRG